MRRQTDFAKSMITVSHESIRRWEAKLLPVMGEALAVPAPEPTIALHCQVRPLGHGP